MAGRTSRMRKIVEQMSNPIFGSGYFWEPKIEIQQQELPTRTGALQQAPRQPKSVEKLVTENSNE